MSDTKPYSRCAPASCLLALAVACSAAAAPPGQSTCEPQSFVVAVDVGHTHKAPGAISARGVPELEFNLALATEVEQTLLAGGFSNSFLINADGKIGSLAARPARAASRGADLFLSVHHDSVQPRYLETWTFDGTTRRYSDRFRGYSLFVSGKNPQFAISRRAATLIGEAFRARGLRPTLHHAEPIRGENRPLLDDTLGLYRFDDLVVLKRAAMPAVLIEAGIIVNRDDERLLAGPARRQLIAAGVLAGVRAFCEELAGDSRSARLGTHATEATLGQTGSSLNGTGSLATTGTAPNPRKTGIGQRLQIGVVAPLPISTSRSPPFARFRDAEQAQSHRPRSVRPASSLLGSPTHAVIMTARNEDRGGPDDLQPTPFCPENRFATPAAACIVLSAVHRECIRHR